jgi:hypothetical protein
MISREGTMGPGTMEHMRVTHALLGNRNRIGQDVGNIPTSTPPG